MSLFVGFLRGTAWGSKSFVHQLNPRWVWQPEVVGTYLPGTGTLGWWGPGVGLGHLTPEISLPKFIHHMDVGPVYPTSVPILPV